MLQMQEESKCHVKNKIGIFLVLEVQLSPQNI